MRYYFGYMAFQIGKPDVVNGSLVTPLSPTAPDIINWGPVGDFLLAGDSVRNLPGNPYDRHQLYNYLAYQAGPNNVHLRHNRRGNFLFADGHIASLARSDLVGRYGEFGTTYHSFVDDAIDETPPQ
jgi:prepilin-type processing-associated H-X9-DG protein